jgi:DNA-binding NarL/FixJ family response regulator
MAAILIIAPLPILREALRQLLNGEFSDPVIGQAGDARTAVRQASARAWDMIILDNGISNVDGHTLLALLRRVRPGAKVLVLGDYHESAYATRMIAAGAAGCVPKTADPMEVRKAIKAMRAGSQYVGRLVSDEAQGAGLPARPASHPPLSAREHEVLVELARGTRITRIAAELQISAKTVTTYRRRILNKLDLGSTADLVRYAASRGLA